MALVLVRVLVLVPVLVPVPSCCHISLTRNLLKLGFLIMCFEIILTFSLHEVS